MKELLKEGQRETAIKDMKVKKRQFADRPTEKGKDTINILRSCSTQYSKLV